MSRKVKEGRLSMRSLTIKISTAVLALSLLFTFCGRDTSPIYFEWYSSVFRVDDRFFVKNVYESYPYPDRCSVFELLPEINETKLIACGLYNFYCEAGRLWHSEGNALYSRTLEDEDWQLELIKEDYRRVWLADIIGDKWLLYSDNWAKLGDDDYTMSYTVLDRKTGEETSICEMHISKWGRLYGWDGEQLFCSIEENLCRVTPESCEIIAEGQGVWGLQAALAADGTAYWADEEEGQLEIFWQDSGSEPKSVKFTLPQYQRFRQMYLTRDEQVMIIARHRGLCSLYCVTPENGRVAVIFNLPLNEENLFFDEENYYYVDLHKKEVRQRPLKPLYFLSE